MNRRVSPIHRLGWARIPGPNKSESVLASGQRRETKGKILVRIAIAFGWFLGTPSFPHLGEPVRILLATDVASEGLDLQNFCSRLIHYEIPWNPNRMEQRNGRIDRHGQRADKILIYHFVGAGYKERDPAPADDRPQVLSKARNRTRRRIVATPGASDFKAEGMGLEPTTPEGAPDFESGCLPIRLPSEWAIRRLQDPRCLPYEGEALWC